MKFFTEKRIKILFILICIAYSMKCIFIDLGIDGEYQLAMAYRMVKGDKLVHDMLEPHQTSAFLCLIFLKIYISIFHTTRFSVLYMQFIGMGIQALTSILYYKAIKKFISVPYISKLSTLLLFILFPKDMCFPEFSNMQIWFSLCIFLLLLRYYDKPKIKYIVFLAPFMIMLVMSYPSCIIAYIAVFICILKYGQRKHLILLIGLCTLLGFGYAFYLFRGMGMEDIALFVSNMFSLEATHQISSLGINKPGLFRQTALYFLNVIGLLSVSMVVAHIAVKLFKKKKEECILIGTSIFFVICLAVNIIYAFRVNEFSRYYYTIILPVITLAGLCVFSKLSDTEKRFFVSGLFIGAADFFGTVMLTDMSIITILPYLKIAVVVSFTVLLIYLEKQKAYKQFYILLKAIAFVFVFAILIRDVYIIRPIYGQINTIFDLRGIVKEGPASGIITDYMSAYTQNVNYNEFSFIPEESNVYLCATNLDTLGYIYKDFNVAAPSVMCTPTYNDTIKSYWEQHPDKYPDVVIVSCWYGSPDACVNEGTWLNNWLENEFNYSTCFDGSYWRFYIK